MGKLKVKRKKLGKESKENEMIFIHLHSSRYFNFQIQIKYALTKIIIRYSEVQSNQGTTYHIIRCS